MKVSVKYEQQKNKVYSLTTDILPIHQSTIPTREGHTTILYRNNAIIMGGHCSGPFATGHLFSLTNHNWTKQFPIPSPRSYHSTLLYKDRYAIIFGGMGSYDISRKHRPCYNSVNIIDLHTLNARPLKMKSEELVPPRRSHAAVLMGKYMLVLGGMNAKR